MLYQNLLSRALEDRREDFQRFDRAWRDEVRDYASRLASLGKRTSLEILDAVSAQVDVGALPSDELERYNSMVVPFGRRWRTHEEARRWAVDALYERVTFAADGSQLLPGREVSLPVAAVQVAWFENPHKRDGEYRKQARFSVLSPADLLEDRDERINAETIVGLRRTSLETEVLREFLESKRGWRTRGERTPVAFFDGSLLISFGLPKTKIQGAFINTMVELVRLSREVEVPVVGYIDQSYARDLVRLLDALGEGEGRERGSSSGGSLYDAQLLHALIEMEQPVLKNWGDRTVFCYCKREGLSASFSDESGKPLIGFTYLQATGEGLPARLDIPVWIYEAGLLDDVMDAVRGECVGGLGYPYSIETADAAAVITARDREQFLRAVQDFAESEKLAFRVSRKAASKVRRR